MPFLWNILYFHVPTFTLYNFLKANGLNQIIIMGKY